MESRFEHSAGGVVVRPVDSGIEVVLAARRRRSGDLAWGLPMGHIEQDEEVALTALREVREETGLDARIREPLGDISYWYVWDGRPILKKVTFFLMDATGGDFADHDSEMEEVRWFPLSEAMRAASYSSEREVLRRAEAALARETKG